MARPGDRRGKRSGGEDPSRRGPVLSLLADTFEQTSDREAPPPPDGDFCSAAEWKLITGSIPHLVAQSRLDRPVRIWCAGCGTGELTYAITMLVAAARDSGELRGDARIFATDRNPAALEIARPGRYLATRLASVAPKLRDRYFTPEGPVSSIGWHLRQTVVFARHELLEDPPFSNLDLLICRAPLGAMDPAARSRLLARFHFALAPGGLLLLPDGEPEDLQSAAFGRRDGLFGVLWKQGASRLADRMALLSEAITQPRAAGVEVANEALQARMVELSTASGDLETVNLELNDTNDELLSVNAQLQVRTAEALQLSGALQEALGRFGVAVIVTGADLRVKTMNPRAEALLLVPLEQARGRDLAQLACEFPMADVARAVRTSVGSRAPVASITLPAQGMTYQLTVSRLTDADGSCQGALILIGSEPAL